MVVGAVIDNKGKPVCCEMWPGNRTDVKALIPVIDRVRSRFNTGQFCIVADRGMISAKNVRELDEREIPYIFGARMRKVKQIREDVLSHPGRYKEVRPEGYLSKDPAPLKVKEVVLSDKRYVVCFNPKQARKDARDRQAIIDSLEEKIKTSPKSLIGNKGYRKYLRVEKNSVSINQDKLEWGSRFDGKWVLITNTEFSVEQVALKYKELWQVEQVFRDIKSVLETRPVYHQKDENIRSGGMCSAVSWHLY
jgi:transposase